MNGIIGVSGLMLDMKLEDTVRHYAGIIRDLGNHMLLLINDILDFSKLEAGQLHLEEIAFDLPAAIGSCVELLLTEANAKGLALPVIIGDSVPRMVRGDPGRLRQILLNLVGNGLKFTAKGEVRVTVAAEKAGQDSVRLICSVSDTGIGIPPDKIGRLFQHFTQVDSSVSRQFGGTGLGLAICRKLVEQMNGSIGVQSVLGEGSTFTFTILLRDAPEALAEAAIEPGSALARTGPLRILVVEDNNTNRLVVTRMLERLGHRVDAVANGLEAVEAVRSIPYALVLMDIMMPEMDGLAATRAIRLLDAGSARVPIIGLTASVLERDREACLAAGMNGFLPKPVSAGRLQKAISQVMSRAVEWVAGD